jgi:hypothetical protein
VSRSFLPEEQGDSVIRTVLRVLLASGLATGVLSACTGTFGPGGSVEIRIANQSDVDFDVVIVGFPYGQEEYGAVSAGGVTGYREVENAYRYAYVEVHVDGDTFVLQPVDYVGEVLLPPGRYTYALDLDPEESAFSLTFRHDG